MRALLACGGSGGHITPAIAMAEMLKKAYPHAVCAFTGNENGMERRIVTENGFPFYPLPIEGLHRSFTLRNLRTLFLVAGAPAKARSIIKTFSPDLVIGTGGYVSYPVIPAAAKLGIPTLLYEPNAIPGLSIRLTEKHATSVLLQFDDCARHFKYRERTRVIGAPLRAGFSHHTRQQAREALSLPQSSFTVLCFGGSLGAECISRAATESFAFAREHGITLIHACGNRLYDALRVKYPKEASERRLLPYIDNMAAYMAAANLVVCRAGAMTLAELARSGRASLLIPSPYVAENHQEKNARLYEKKGAALLMTEEELDADALRARILFLKQNPSLLSRMEKNARMMDTENTEERFLSAVNQIFEKAKPAKK